MDDFYGGDMRGQKLVELFHWRIRGKGLAFLILLEYLYQGNLKY
jgi:hypothetical protein